MLRRLVPILVFVSLSCDAESPVALGGGHALVRGAGASCPTSYPFRHDAGDHVICADGAFAVAHTTRAECEAHALDCDVLYGCEAPVFDACDSTSTTADCGGAGPATFACTDQLPTNDCAVSGTCAAGCRWFVGGCLPAGWVASRCPTGDLCCEAPEFGPADAGPSLGVPFPSGTLGAPGSLNANYRALDFAARYGAQPITLDQGFVVPVVETTLPADTGIVLSCPVSAPTPYFCVWQDRYSASNGVDAFAVYSANLGSEGFAVELRDVGGTTRARVCTWFTTDLAPRTCSSSAPALSRCFDDGLVELDASRVRISAGGLVVSFPR